MESGLTVLVLVANLAIVYIFGLVGVAKLIGPVIAVESLGQATFLSRSVRTFMIRCISSLEIGIAFLLIAGLTAGRVDLIRAAARMGLVVLCAYLAFVAWLVKKRPGVSCGCDSSGQQATTWTVLRNAVLVVLAFVCSLTASLAQPTDLAPTAVVACLAISAGLTYLIWQLPAWLNPALLSEAWGPS